MFHMWDFGAATGWWMGFNAIWMVLFWGGIIGLGIWAIKKFTNAGNSSKRDALDIARERYARGEITKEEFEQIKRTLS